MLNVLETFDWVFFIAVYCWSLKKPFPQQIYFINHSPPKLVLQSSEILAKFHSKSVVFYSNTHQKSENSSQILKTRSNFWCLDVINKKSRWGEVGFGIWLKQHGKIPNPTSPQRDVCYNNLCYQCHCTATLLLGWVTPLLLFPFSWSCTQPLFSSDFLCGIFIPIFFHDRPFCVFGIYVDAWILHGN